ncbi:hypothetical protein COSO111634_16220 [Corallococcus soli]
MGHEHQHRGLGALTLGETNAKAKPFAWGQVRDRLQEDGPFPHIHKPEPLAAFQLKAVPLQRRIEDEGRQDPSSHPQDRHRLRGTARQGEPPVLALTRAGDGLGRDGGS